MSSFFFPPSLLLFLLLTVLQCVAEVVPGAVCLADPLLGLEHPAQSVAGPDRHVGRPLAGRVAAEVAPHAAVPPGLRLLPAAVAEVAPGARADGQVPGRHAHGARLLAPPVLLAVVPEGGHVHVAAAAAAAPAVVGGGGARAEEVQPGEAEVGRPGLILWVRFGMRTAVESSFLIKSFVGQKCDSPLTPPPHPPHQN